MADTQSAGASAVAASELDSECDDIHYSWADVSFADSQASEAPAESEVASMDVDRPTGVKRKSRFDLYSASEIEKTVLPGLKYKKNITEYCDKLQFDKEKVRRSLESYSQERALDQNTERQVERIISCIDEAAKKQ